MASRLQKKSLFDKLKEQEEKLSDNFQEDTNVEEDYLDVDKSLPNQNWVCLSFVSPEKVLKTKEDYYYYYYTLELMSNFREFVKKETDKLLEKALTGTVDSSELVEFRKTLSTQVPEELEFKDFKDKLDNFKYRNEEEVEKMYHEENNFNTTMRGIKIRGVFNTYEQAQVRSKVLQKMDKNFNVFIGQVGYWLPWDPNPDNIEEQEYMNSKLNKIVKAYKENQEKKDAFFEEELQKKQEEAAKRRREAREKKKQESQQQGEEEQEQAEAQQQGEDEQHDESNPPHQYDETQPEEESNPLEEVMDRMNSESHTPGSMGTDSSLAEERAKIEDIDPWMQRKMRQEAGYADEDI